jgi:Ca-activated chloride channel family protein
VAEFQTEARYIDCAWLLTDGLANVGIVSQEELTNHASELRKRGISTTTFGVGLDFNEDLLRAMAEKGGGNFYFIDSSKQVKNYFEGELGERLNTVARGLALQIEFPEGVGLDCVNNYEMSRGSSRIILQLGDMYAGEERRVLVKVTTPASPLGNQLKLNALLMFTNPKTGEGHEVRVTDDLTLTSTSDQECNAQVIEAELKEIIGQLLVARTKQEILTANRQGDYAGVQSAAAVLRQQVADAKISDAPAVQKELAELEQLSQDASAPLEPAKAKGIHYSSHMSSRSRKDYKKEEK